MDEFLHGRRAMSMATVGAIQLVAMWYGFLDGDIVFETKAKSQKIANLRRDPRLTVLVEDGERYEELRGVEIVGRGEIIEDPDTLWQIGVSVFERYQGPYSEEMRPFVEVMMAKRVGVRLRADKVVSWDHRKLGLGSTSVTT
ncbi:MAG: PPOX class F420-dependent oxidoreductase [Acidimicrobiales bacterium]